MSDAIDSTATTAPPVQQPPFDCGECEACLDKPKYGGPGRKKKACERRRINIKGYAAPKQGAISDNCALAPPPQDSAAEEGDGSYVNVFEPEVIGRRTRGVTEPPRLFEPSDFNKDTVKLSKLPLGKHVRCTWGPHKGALGEVLEGVNHQGYLLVELLPERDAFRLRRSQLDPEVTEEAWLAAGGGDADETQASTGGSKRARTSSVAADAGEPRRKRPPPLKQDDDEPRGGGGGGEVVDEGQQHVKVVHIESGKMRSGPSAPMRKNLAVWLLSNPEWREHNPRPANVTGGGGGGGGGGGKAGQSHVDEDGFGIGAEIELTSGSHTGCRGTVTSGRQGYWEVHLTRNASGERCSVTAMVRRGSCEVRGASGSSSRSTHAKTESCSSSGKKRPAGGPVGGGGGGSGGGKARVAGSSGSSGSGSGVGAAGGVGNSGSGSTGGSSVAVAVADGLVLSAKPQRRKLLKAEAEELLQSRSSWLANAPLAPKVISWHVFSQLTPAEQRELAKLLPECDREPEHWERALRSEQLQESVRDWQEQLAQVRRPPYATARTAHRPHCTPAALHRTHCAAHALCCTRTVPRTVPHALRRTHCTARTEPHALHRTHCAAHALCRTHCAAPSAHSHAREAARPTRAGCL